MAKKAVVTEKMVQAVCEDMAANDWLPRDWEGKWGPGEEKCDKCGQHRYYGEGDGGANVKHEVRLFLEIALKHQPNE